MDGDSERKNISARQNQSSGRVVTEKRMTRDRQVADLTLVHRREMRQLAQEIWSFVVVSALAFAPFGVPATGTQPDAPSLCILLTDSNFLSLLSNWTKRRASPGTSRTKSCAAER